MTLFLQAATLAQGQARFNLSGVDESKLCDSFIPLSAHMVGFVGYIAFVHLFLSIFPMMLFWEAFGVLGRNTKKR